MPRPVDQEMPADSMGTSNAGITGATGGSAGGASMSDLKRGYTDCNDEADYPSYLEPAAAPQGGFLNRPRGWER